MSNNNSALDKVLAVGAIVGGAFLLGALFEAFGKSVVLYKCPNCNFDKVKRDTPCCPNCGTTLDWSNVHKNGGSQ